MAILAVKGFGPLGFNPPAVERLRRPWTMAELWWDTDLKGLPYSAHLRVEEFKAGHRMLLLRNRLRTEGTRKPSRSSVMVGRKS